MLRPPIRLIVYMYSSDDAVNWKQADMEIEISGGLVRFFCTVELGEDSNILPETLRIADFDSSEMLHDGTEPAQTLLLEGAEPVMNDNIYPVGFMKPEVFSHALSVAAAAVVERLYETEYQ